MRRTAYGRVVLVGGLVAALVLSLTGAAVAKEQITAIFATDKPWVPEVAREFEQQTGIAVNLVLVDWNSILTKVMAGAAARVAPYDVMEADLLWLPAWVKAGIIDPIDPYLTAADRDGLLRPLVNAVTFNGRTYAMPWIVDALFFMYNQEVLAQVGVGAPPATWDELASVSQKIKGQSQLRYPIIWPWTQHEGEFCNYLVFLQTHGGQIMSGDRVVVDTPAGVRALETMLRLKQAGLVDPGSFSSRGLQTMTALAQELNTFTINWGSLYSLANDPARSKAVGKIRIGLIPAAPGHSTSTVDGSEAVAVAARSGNKQAAWQFVQYLTSREVARRVAVDYRVLGPWRDLYEDPALHREVPDIGIMGQQLAFAASRPMVTWYDELSLVMQVKVLEALLEQKAPQVVLREAQAEIDKLQARAR